jgi:FkbM family methyltransferase
MKFYYGANSTYIDITEIVYNKYLVNNIITIPNSDINRANIFGDPLHGIVKNIKVVDNNNNVKIFYEDNDIELHNNSIHNPVMKFLYGIKNNYNDVTSIVYDNFIKDDIVIIPTGDLLRASYFTDHLVQVKKHIKVIDKYCNCEYFNDDEEFNFNINIDFNKSLNFWYNKNCKNINNYERRLNRLHEKITLKYGSLKDEFPEQLMAIQFIKPESKVLEIGANIGRNTIIIGSILNNGTNLVTLETSKDIYEQLNENRIINNMDFQIENSALSLKKLIQIGWDTIVSDVVLPGYSVVNIISYEDLKKKYNMVFDTLVLDCEGAFYYILQDMPEILQDINLIIMENDYHNIEHKKFVDNMMYQYGFKKIYSKAGGWGPCLKFFFETWSK